MTDLKITPEQQAVMDHTIGLDFRRKHDRNYYSADADNKICNSLVDLGLMEKGGSIPGGLTSFRVSEKGMEFMKVRILEHKIRFLESENARFLQIIEEHDLTWELI